MAADGGGVSLDNAEAWDIGAALGDICEAAASVIMPFWRAGVTVRAACTSHHVGVGGLTSYGFAQRRSPN